MDKGIRIKTAWQLVRLAKSLVAGDDQKTQKYFDDIETYCLSEELAKYGWCIYDYATDIDDGENVIGRRCSVWTQAEEDKQQGEENDGKLALPWDKLKTELDGQENSIDNGRTVVFNCEEYGPSGYSVSFTFK